MARDESSSYHHGDLARAALDAAYVLVAKQGAAALSMREVAGGLGVTHRALYRHYADREALLDAVAARGYEALADVLPAAPGRTKDAPRAFLQAYAGFALAEPEIYALMMARDGRRMATHPALRAATRRVIALSQQAFGGGPQGSAAQRDRIIALWSLLHGAIALYRAGLIRAGSRKQFVDYMLKLAGERISD
ncbi:TetR/AcrR family transcriptional regulator [Desertibaculum subflavum]|uniref:TetR/AcrR family transcriptional regulator n=1 Tax=Desertibaculum subflavum TaxID=2268458 RepID=UPI000E66BF8A